MKEGLVWRWPGASRKAHVFSGATSLCRKWAYTGPEQGAFDPARERPGPDDCAQCFRAAKRLHEQGKAAKPS